jgi:hypothetical protein
VARGELNITWFPMRHVTAQTSQSGVAEIAANDHNIIWFKISTVQDELMMMFDRPNGCLE